MKKLVCLLLTLFSLFILCSCGTSNSNLDLVYGKRYIRYYDVKSPTEQQTYIIFYKDGTAEYHEYGYSYNAISHYTKKLVCEPFAEENTIFCFYDGIEFHPDHVGNRNFTNDDVYTFVCSKNVIMLTSGTEYILEDYLVKIPNFDK